jgi:hypothetical protein
MTHEPHDDNAAGSARRLGRYKAREWLWHNSSVSRLRACGLNAQATGTASEWASELPTGHGRQHALGRPVIGTNLGRAAAANAETVAFRLAGEAGARRASVVGVQSCGSTWACPVCAEKIQARRHDEVRQALEVAERMGWVVGFLTFTVRHKRSHSLSAVWAGVGDAWRRATSGAGPAWVADQDRYGVRGYLRLTEVTLGENGWHVHVHALVFLDPDGRLVTKRVRVPLPGRAGFVGPLNAEPVYRYTPEGQEFVRWRLQGDDVDLVAEQRRPKVVDENGDYRPLIGPLPAKQLNAHSRQYRIVPVSQLRVPAGVVVERDEADQVAGKRLGERGLYLRDVRALADSMFGRWSAGLPREMMPTRRNGVDARLVTDSDLATYFAKGVYDVKAAGSAASDVTSSYAKTAKGTNVTPFGLLARIVEAGEAAAPADVARWHEWEGESRGKRQLRWSDGLRAALGLVDDVDDEAIANEADDDDGTRDLVVMKPADYRRICLSGLLPECLRRCELDDDGHALSLLLDHLRIPWVLPAIAPPAAA